MNGVEINCPRCEGTIILTFLQQIKQLSRLWRNLLARPFGKIRSIESNSVPPRKL